MTDFYMNYLDLCKEKNLQPVSDEAAKLWGVSKAAISGWKNKDSMPSYDAMFNMMKYFDIAIPVLENRELFLENHSFFITIEGRINGRLAYMRCYDLFHATSEFVGFDVKNTMLSLEPEGTISVRPSTPEEIEKYTRRIDGTEDNRYKIVSQAEAHRIFKEKTGQYISLGH
ncbi:MAG: helix-turn-helix transcriptional regulator [Butyrivibrio sp.]|uniref:helix-turn-helix domain-containing protein n=1 Tax=Butyrivibrio sp. TaxID=28121 RepID=UPI001B14804E|nr:helix-turn-helix transcriptional regulator [Butyrivibrio sp.]MBO6241955.1 helix-turn-helix transcriptional regulator [Butyrivibrio sp.]